MRVCITVPLPKIKIRERRPNNKVRERKTIIWGTSTDLMGIRNDCNKILALCLNYC